jgi:hypothetical protein
MGIPFTQYLLPNGRKRQEKIDRSPEIEELAERFIKAGGRYECEILTTGHVSITAVYVVDEEEQDIVIKVCQNGSEVPDAVDYVVRESVKRIDHPNG